jgi:protein-S-isoprenylcysteine O-methyltransferase Ste14
MTSGRFNFYERLGDFQASGLLRPAAEKFAGAWLACFLVMTRGSVFAAFSLEHVRLATICGLVGGVVTVALLAQMDRSVDSLGRQATISALVTFIGDTFAHPSHFPPQWAEPLVTAVLSAVIAMIVWCAKRYARSIWVPTPAGRR